MSAKCSTCFRLFLRPSSRAHKLYIKHQALVKPLLLPFGVVEELEIQPHHDSER
jgi:predicted membrane chloride channel (bestrophin family)